MNKYILYFIFLIFFMDASAQTTWYVSPAGIDANAGTIDFPFKTITQAVTVAVAGDTIYLRGGSHIYTGTASTTISIGKSGTTTARFYLFAYPSEIPVLDFSATSVNSKGLKLSGAYWHFKGINFYGAGGNGLILTGATCHHNIIEQCNMYENRNSGMQMENGATENQIINCDSYFNVDATQGNADGFAPKLDVGQNNYFYGCRSWQNSDDGWDGYLNDNITDISTVLENCWCFSNGYLKSGSASSGNGNGFKLGGSSAKTSMHNMTLRNCLAFNNRVKGFDQNNDKGNIILYNCTSFSNGTNYGLNSSGGVNTAAGKQMIVKNSVSAGTGSITIWSGAVQEKNSWLSPYVVSNADFISVDTTGVRGARKPDGSLPDINFMHLAAGSDLIDTGVNVGLPFNGLAPDLGAFETLAPVPVKMFSFTGALGNNGVTLYWKMANEINNAGWTIERKQLNSNNSSNWQTLGFVPGAINSSSVTAYSFLDKTIGKGIYQYRLKQTDLDGRFSYSHLIHIKNDFSASEQILSVFPNPFTTSTTIQYTVPVKGKIVLNIYNQEGQLITSLLNATQETGIYQYLLNGERLPAGKYTVRLSMGDKIISSPMLKLY